MMNGKFVFFNKSYFFVFYLEFVLFNKEVSLLLLIYSPNYKYITKIYQNICNSDQLVNHCLLYDSKYTILFSN